MYKAHIKIDTALDCTGFIEQNFTLKEISNIIEDELSLDELQKLIIGKLIISVKYYTEEKEEENKNEEIFD